MTFQIDTSKGWTETIIDSDCEFYKFEKIASILKTELNIVFTGQLNDFDTFYWDFTFKSSTLCLYYNIYLGVSIYPKLFQKANQADNDNVIEVANNLIKLLEDYNWRHFDSGKSIGKSGSEGGIIISDLENNDGARITVEKDCGNIPFAVTVGIYGLMFHTHFDSSLEKANLFVRNSKFKINQVFEMYSLPEINRTEFWHRKHNSLIEEIAEINNN
jgi:hypothetical protein